jgi:glutathione S-transferase
MTKTPILYSLQNCPYAMRARIALFKANQQVLIRAIKLNNKPKEMLLVSPKGTVPVLVIPESSVSNSTRVIDESLEVMVWALSQSDPDNLLCSEDDAALPNMVTLISDFEIDFIPLLNSYSCAKRYHENNITEWRRACETHLELLENNVSKYSFLLSNQETLVDIALLPFIRKFARVDKPWFQKSPYPNLRQWLNRYLQSPMFSKVMEQHELWLEHRNDIYFGQAASNKRKK